MTGIESSGERATEGEMPCVGVEMTDRGEGLCKMAPGAFVDLLALYDTPAERSICFSACSSARCWLTYLIFRAARELRRMYNRDVWLCRHHNNSDRS